MSTHHVQRPSRVLISGAAGGLGSAVARRFAADRERRAAAGATVVLADDALIAALSAGFPACAGVALGVDRLLMAMLGTSRIADVLAFDFARA